MQFEIAATADPGVFGVSAKLMGVDVEKVELVFQVTCLCNYSRPSLSRLRLSRITAYLEEKI